MPELLQQIYEYLRGMWRFRRLAVFGQQAISAGNGLIT
jgi:hypothetical protein